MSRLSVERNADGRKKVCVTVNRNRALSLQIAEEYLPKFHGEGHR